MSNLRCWQCGVEPTGLAEGTTLGDVEPRYLPTGWPSGDHPHAEREPTPGELLAAGAQAFDRVMAEWSR